MTETSWLLGYHAVRALLVSARPADAVLIQHGRHDRRMREIADLAGERDVPVELVPRQRLDRLAEGAPHNGCAARAAAVGYRPLLDLVAEVDQPGRIVLLDHVLDPHNVGAVIRSAAAFAVGGVVVAGPSAPPLAGTVARAAAGHLERVPLARTRVAVDALSVLRGEGYWVLGADARGRPIAEVDPGQRWVLCLGAEEHGLRAKTRAAVDELVAIPMAAGVESLNVSVSAGILLYALAAASARPT
jgi:23S rRNA (guanosine2251-2'-O)-methyltransferase